MHTEQARQGRHVSLLLDEASTLPPLLWFSLPLPYGFAVSVYLVSLTMALSGQQHSLKLLLSWAIRWHGIGWMDRWMYRLEAIRREQEQLILGWIDVEVEVRRRSWLWLGLAVECKLSKWPSGWVSLASVFFSQHLLWMSFSFCLFVADNWSKLFWYLIPLKWLLVIIHKEFVLTR